MDSERQATCVFQMRNKKYLFSFHPISDHFTNTELFMVRDMMKGGDRSASGRNCIKCKKARGHENRDKDGELNMQ